ncbi:flagellar M-ring protein FliF [Bacillus oleivorans]|uniref:Flagellar M-ring protein n=1 Tax=Bacillus oleivorans TaxID=1448271 RepID=A0A285D1U1_9BACI|nr:flagellar basal-body MS-ring/collar protein FliF [Bacillus oleivorans]SNX73635.1 flagellar M-ring protein FliF [Bacillus oleivorans]
MNESLLRQLKGIQTFWKERTRQQRLAFVSAILIIFISLTVIILLASKSNMVPLYSNLSPSETGVIKETLDGRGIDSVITDGGTTISVPEQFVDTLKVELAAEGIPDSGQIDYSFFSDNAGIGTTEQEFNVMKLDAMQTELANLIKGIDGVEDAQVMLSLPEQGIFVSDAAGEASASIVLHTKPGYSFSQDQIFSLYHLVSKSVPNLPTDNIVIMNQYFEYFDLNNNGNIQGSTIFQAQYEMQKQIERDIQREVQRMLGTIMGQDKVVVSVTTDIDFTQENREETLVEPVDEENMEGITISAQRLTETFTGNAEQAAGVPQGEDPTDPLNQYMGTDGSNGDYERIEETINNEVNRIRKEIVESPYKIKDVGIQVMVEPPVPDDPNSLPEGTVEDITQMLSTIVRTSIHKDAESEEISDQVLEDKIVVSVQRFNGKTEMPSNSAGQLPWWIYAVGGVLILLIIILLVLFMRSRSSQAQQDYIFDEEEATPIHVPDLNEEKETEGTVKRKQLEQLAKNHPEEFVKLLRSWLTQD